PDFRERVHRGENFLIAGDRFAIGSSREMSPAGLKGVAEEAGLEMVIVCGSNMGDIFRRNALNLGLQVVQSPEAVADAKDGDQFSFDPETRRLTNETQRKTYQPVPLTPKEDEIRRTGGIFAAGRREFRASGAIANDHFVFTGKADDEKQTGIGREFARLHGIEKPYYATPGDGIFHFYFPEQALVAPGQFIPGADSHSRAYGAYGAVGMGVGST